MLHFLIIASFLGLSLCSNDDCLSDDKSMVIDSTTCFCLSRQKLNNQLIIWRFQGSNSNRITTMYNGTHLKQGLAEQGWNVHEAGNESIRLCGVSGIERAGKYESYSSLKDKVTIPLAYIVSDTTLTEITSDSGASIRTIPSTSPFFVTYQETRIQITRTVLYAGPCVPFLDWKISPQQGTLKSYSIRDSREKDAMQSVFEIPARKALNDSIISSLLYFKCLDQKTDQFSLRAEYNKPIRSPVFYREEEITIEKPSSQLTEVLTSKIVSQNVETIFRGYSTDKSTRGNEEHIISSESVGDIYRRSITLAFAVMFPFFVIIIIVIIIVVVLLRKKQKTKQRRDVQGTYENSSTRKRLAPPPKELDNDQLPTTPENEYTGNLTNSAVELAYLSPSAISDAYRTSDPSAIYDRINEDEINVNTYDNQVPTTPHTSSYIPRKSMDTQPTYTPLNPTAADPQDTPSPPPLSLTTEPVAMATRPDAEASLATTLAPTLVAVSKSDVSLATSLATLSSQSSSSGGEFVTYSRSSRMRETGMDTYLVPGDMR